MPTTDELRAGDPVVVARFLQIRTVLDRHMARVERLVLDQYDGAPTRRLTAPLPTHLRSGFVRPGQGELWPGVFLAAVDLTPALVGGSSPERVADIRPPIHGPP